METKSKTLFIFRHQRALSNIIYSLLVGLFLPQLCLSQYQVAPVVRYSFDDDTEREYNAISEGYDASFSGVGSKPAGLFGKAYKRGDRTYVYSDFPADNSFTLSFWINTPERKALNLYEVDGYFRVWLDVHENLIHLENLSSGEKVSSTLLLNEWVPIVVTGNGSTLKLYSGGDRVELSIGPESPKDKRVRFGNVANSGYAQFNGLMDEVRVYDEVLAAGHIEEISSAETAFDSIPIVVADAGIHHTLFLDSLSNRVTASLSGSNAGEGEVLDRHWSVEDQPDLARSPEIHLPSSDQTEVTFYQPGEYVLRYTIQGRRGSHTGRCTVRVFEPRQPRPPGNLHNNPFAVGTHLPGFRDPVESGAYSKGFVDQYFHETPPKLVMEGYQDGVFKAPPAPYEHPRLYFNHEELREIRGRLHYTESGRKILEQLQRAVQGYERAASIPHYFTLTGDTDAGVTYDYDAKHSQLHVNLAFYALIKADSDLAKTVIDAAVHMAEGQLRFIEVNRKDDTPTTINSFLNFQNALGRNALAQVYDYLYIWMTDDQRDLLRSVLAAATHQADAPLMWTIPQGMLTSNFVPWWTANMLTNVTAIEDEDGYDPIVAQEAQLAMTKFYLNGIFKDGSPREGLGKNALGAQALILLAKRGVHAIAYENVYNYVTKFHLHTIHPSGKFFIADDLWGGSRTISPGTKAETAVLKYAYPDDPVVDYVYRCAVRGEEYTAENLETVHTYSSGIVNCILGLDWSGDRDVHVHQQEALNSEPTSRLFNYTNIAMDRTGWDTNAGYIYFNARVHGGHPMPSRGTFVFHSLGRDWSIYPSGRSGHSDLHSVVMIDGHSTSGKFARMMAYDSDNERSIFAADLRTVYQNHVLNTFNDYRLYRRVTSMMICRSIICQRGTMRIVHSGVSILKRRRILGKLSPHCR